MQRRLECRKDIVRQLISSYKTKQRDALNMAKLSQLQDQLKSLPFPSHEEVMEKRNACESNNELHESLIMLWLALYEYQDNNEILSEEGFIHLFTRIYFVLLASIANEEAIELAKHEYSLWIRQLEVLHWGNFCTILIEFVEIWCSMSTPKFFAAFTWMLFKHVVDYKQYPPKLLTTKDMRHGGKDIDEQEILLSFSKSKSEIKDLKQWMTSVNILPEAHKRLLDRKRGTSMNTDDLDTLIAITRAPKTILTSVTSENEDEYAGITPVGSISGSPYTQSPSRVTSLINESGNFVLPSLGINRHQPSPLLLVGQLSDVEGSKIQAANANTQYTSLQTAYEQSCNHHPLVYDVDRSDTIMQSPPKVREGKITSQDEGELSINQQNPLRKGLSVRVHLDDDGGDKEFLRPFRDSRVRSIDLLKSEADRKKKRAQSLSNLSQSHSFHASQQLLSDDGDLNLASESMLQSPLKIDYDVVNSSGIDKVHSLNSSRSPSIDVSISDYQLDSHSLNVGQFTSDRSRINEKTWDIEVSSCVSNLPWHPQRFKCKKTLKPLKYVDFKESLNIPVRRGRIPTIIAKANDKANSRFVYSTSTEQLLEQFSNHVNEVFATIRKGTAESESRLSCSNVINTHALKLKSLERPVRRLSTAELSQGKKLVETIMTDKSNGTNIFAITAIVTSESNKPLSKEDNDDDSVVSSLSVASSINPKYRSRTSTKGITPPSLKNKSLANNILEDASTASLSSQSSGLHIRSKYRNSDINLEEADWRSMSSKQSSRQSNSRNPGYYGPWIPVSGVEGSISDKADYASHLKEVLDLNKSYPVDVTKIATVLKRQDVIRSSFERFSDNSRQKQATTARDESDNISVNSQLTYGSSSRYARH